MTEQRIAEIHARCEAATPGPWEWGVCNESWGEVEAESLKGVITLKDDYPGYPECGEHLIMELSKPDADFIAHSREDVPFLLDQLAERDREIERLREAQRWIPVAERLPENTKGVQRTWFLVALSNGVVTQLAYEFEHYTNMIFDVGWHSTAHPVTHWMPLPEPPGEGE